MTASIGRPTARIRPGGGAAVAGLLLVLGLSACGSAPEPALPYGAGSAGPPATSSAPAPAADDAPADTGAGEGSDRVEIPPVSVELDGAKPAPVGLADVTPDGFLDVPEEVDRLGWWVGSTPMGATKGTTLIAGHVDSAVAGLGVFARLQEMSEGDPVTVVDGIGKRWEFVISEKEEVTKSALPDTVFDTEGERRLALVTCGGPFDQAAGHYRDNLIVWATPA